MVDFAKLREQNKANARRLAEAPIPPSELDRVNHILTFHLTELTDWEEGFVYSQKEWLTKKPGNYLSDKTATKLKEIEDSYCGSKCHAR